MAPIGVQLVRRRELLTGLLGGLVVSACRGKSDGADAEIGPLLPPRSLADRIDDVKAGKIVVFYVGPDGLFGHGHVPGAKKLGAVESAEGRRALKEALAGVGPETEIVVYCGCCPVRSCPNVRPASAAIRALGRTNAHVLDLPTRFATDWAEKGYPVART